MNIHAIRTDKDGNEYGLKVIICANAETLCGWEDPTGNGNADEAAEVVSAGYGSIYASLGIMADSDRNFSRWNGGKYGSQARMHGYESFGNIVAKAFIRSADEVEWEACDFDELYSATEIRQALEAASSAMDEHVRKFEAA